ncbi:MAG: acyltransferase [Acidobacteria bacterium]|nr:acyltransferase [Acidobacteriota bacterium]
MTRPPKSGYLPTLDGWRAIAIFGVLVDHLVSYSELRHHPQIVAFTRTGPNGVSLFFAISGFLICSRLLEEQNACGKISLRGFYIRRACRILPPAILYLVVIGILALLGSIIVVPAEWWSSVFFFRNYLPKGWIRYGWGGYTVHYWSLAVEEHFYLLWPAVLVLLGKLRARWFALALAVAVAGWRMLDFREHWFDRVIPGLLFGSRTDVRLDALLLGCLAALLLDDASVRALFVGRFRPWMWILCVAGYVLMQVLHRVRTYSIWESGLLTLVVVGTVYHPEGWIGRLLESAVLRWVGRLSYGIYLWQQFFCIPTAGSRLVFLQRFPVNLIMIFLVSWLSYQIVERPFIRLGHRLAPPSSEGREDLASDAKQGISPTSPPEVEHS